jgi:rhodanese-related sulfurtransferase
MKKFWTLLWICLLLSGLLLTISCSSAAKTTGSSTGTITTTESTDVPAITTQDANTMIQNNNNNTNFVLLDVRTADEFSGGHIEGAVNIDYYAADFKTNIGKLDKTKVYLVYCRTGVRGAASVKIMLDLGFRQTQNMTGGITKWVNDGYTTVK